MQPRTLYDKLWDSHLVKQRDDGSALIYIDRHLIHEVTSPQAFEGLRLASVFAVGGFALVWRWVREDAAVDVPGEAKTDDPVP